MKLMFHTSYSYHLQLADWCTDQTNYCCTTYQCIVPGVKTNDKLFLQPFFFVVVVFKQPALKTDTDVVISVSWHVSNWTVNNVAPSNIICKAFTVGANAVSIYLNGPFTAAIKADIRRQSEAGANRRCCFSHCCEAGERSIRRSRAQ